MSPTYLQNTMKCHIKY